MRLKCEFKYKHDILSVIKTKIKVLLLTLAETNNAKANEPSSEPECLPNKKKRFIAVPFFKLQVLSIVDRSIMRIYYILSKTIQIVYLVSDIKIICQSALWFRNNILDQTQISQIYMQVLSLFVVLYETRYDQHN